MKALILIFILNLTTPVLADSTRVLSSSLPGPSATVYSPAELDIPLSVLTATPFHTSFQKLIQDYPELMCEKNTLAQSDLADFRCYSCRFQKDRYRLVFGFYQKDKKDTACEIESLTVEYLDSETRPTQKEFPDPSFLATLRLKYGDPKTEEKGLIVWEGQSEDVSYSQDRKWIRSGEGLSGQPVLFHRIDFRAKELVSRESQVRTALNLASEWEEEHLKKFEEEIQKELQKLKVDSLLGVNEEKLDESVGAALSKVSQFSDQTLKSVCLYRLNQVFPESFSQEETAELSKWQEKGGEYIWSPSEGVYAYQQTLWENLEKESQESLVSSWIRMWRIKEGGSFQSHCREGAEAYARVLEMIDRDLKRKGLSSTHKSLLLYFQTLALETQYTVMDPSDEKKRSEVRSALFASYQELEKTISRLKPFVEMKRDWVRLGLSLEMRRFYCTL